ncbi:nudC domain-containing protein 1 [Halichoerus grypus]
MEVAANCSLRVKRPLLDPRFEGYKLSLEPLPCYQLELDAAVAEVKLRDDQYTLEHMHAFGMYNYLHCDSWYQDSVYYVDNLGRVMNLTVMLDTALGKPREVFRLPTDLTAYDSRLCASIHFTSSTWVTLSDGTGRLYLIGTGERGNSASEKWEIMFNEELGNPFIIIHSVLLLNAEEHSVTTLLLRIEKEALDMKGSGFYVSLEWVTIRKNKDNNKYEIIKRDILRGKSVPHYAAIEPDGKGLMIVSYKSFTFVHVGQDLEENKNENMSEKIKDTFIYFIFWSKNPNPDKEKPPCNAQELEECDIFFEESSSLCRFDGSTLKTTHVVNLGSNQYLFSVIVDPKEMPCFCLRHDVDALLWQPHSSKQDDMWEHIATFNALGYVQASKRDKKFFACAPNYSYAALCECLRRVFIYRQPTPMSTVLYNRKEGRQVGQVAKQQVASLETNDPILGFQATNERLFVLTTKNLFLIKVNTEN